MSEPVRSVTVITHRRPDDVEPALEQLRAAAAEAGVELCFDPEEVQKHGIEPGAGLSLHVPVGCPADLCIVLGGDGTILQALRTYLGTGTPVFAVNYGEVGFLATAGPASESPTSPTRWARRRSAACGATAWSPRPRRGPRATTSPTGDR